MKSLRRWTIAIAALGCGAVGGSLAAGCGSGDDNMAAPPTDAAPADATTDRNTPADGSIDHAAPDSMAATDGQAVDASGAMDALGDGGTPDDASDGSPVRDASDASDTVDASDTSDGADAYAALLAYPMQVATTFCAQLASCCYGGDAAAASQFDLASCASTDLPGGYAETIRNAILVLDSGTLALNPRAAQTCLDDLKNVDCTANVLTQQGQIQMLADCVAAIEGTLEAGAPCTQAVQCAGDQYCATPSDGGPGTCTPLSSDGGSCDFGTQAVSYSACSLRGAGADGLRCVNWSLDGGYHVPDAATWTCGPSLPDGSLCNTDFDCTSQLCGTANTCVSARPFAVPVVCKHFVVADAGDQ